ncbi:MAG TPA: SpoIIE family protein phosphatase [Bryobacteraceae bacterium]|nr:SpoIIE family protein phosphatase [Bryobacteraceae bacterium]
MEHPESAAPVPAPFLRLTFARIWVRDQERSRRFFVEQLGFEAIVDVENPGVGRWIVVAPRAPEWLPGTSGGLPGVALIGAAEGSEEYRRIGQDTGLSFLTEDVGEVFDDWSKRGVCFPQPPVEPKWTSAQARYAIFQDVDGNRFSLLEFDQATRALEAERLAQAAKRDAERQAAHDLAIAKAVQSRLFPQQHPPLRSLAYAGICHPARDVGGDYYDFLDLGSGRLGLVIADIVGKGMAAALLMANLQANLRSHCATAWEQPQRFLQSVNRLFYDNTGASDYATVFFAEYEDATRLLRYSNCGHPCAFLLRRAGTIERLESTCTVMGLFERWECPVEQRQLDPGDTLLVYTDGATESFDEAGEEFGEDRLLEALRRHRDLSSPDLLTAITDEVKKFSRQEQADDITFIAAKCV